MFAVTRAVLAWIVVAGLPGWLICDALRVGAGRARNLALAPVAGLGAVCLGARVVEAVRLPVDPSTVVPLCCGGGLAIWLYARRSRRDGGRASWRGRLPDLFSGAALLLAMALGIAVWFSAIRDFAVIPNTDGAIHALFVSRIEAAQSVNSQQITAVGGTGNGGYYPLALHVSAALVSSLASVPPGTALTVAVVLAAAVALPAGTFVLTRRLDPLVRPVAGIAAVLSVLFAWFPYSPMIWGGVPTVVGMCLIPAVVDALWPLRADGSWATVGACAGVAAVGLFQTHNPQLLAAAAVALVLVLANRGLVRSDRKFILAVWTLSATLVVAAGWSALLATSGIASSGGAAAAQGGSHGLGGTPSSFFASGLVGKVLSPPILVCSVVGIAICVLDRRCRGIGVVFLGWVALFLGMNAHVPVVSALATPWYQEPLRLSYYLALPVVIWAAVGVEKVGAAIGWGIARLARGRTAWSGAGAAVLVLVVAAAQLPSAVAMTGDVYRRAVLIGPDQLAAFAWLDAHVPKGSRVLNTFDDGSGWMGVLGSAQPVFATKPEEFGAALWGARWHLLTHAGALSRDATDQRAVRDWHVEYAYTDSRHFPGTPPLAFTARTLESSPAYIPVWSRGSVKIFRVLLSETT